MRTLVLIAIVALCSSASAQARRRVWRAAIVYPNAVSQEQEVGPGNVDIPIARSTWSCHLREEDEGTRDLVCSNDSGAFRVVASRREPIEVLLSGAEAGDGPILLVVAMTTEPISRRPVSEME